MEEAKPTAAAVNEQHGPRSRYEVAEVSASDVYAGYQEEVEIEGLFSDEGPAHLRHLAQKMRAYKETHS